MKHRIVEISFVLIVLLPLLGAAQPRQSPPTDLAFAMGATHAGLAFNDADSGDFGSRFSWYVAAVQRRVSMNWIQSTIDPTLSSAPRVIVAFDILRSGAITNIQIAQSSDNYSVDSSAMNAVRKSSPLQALPGDYGGSRVSAKFYFDYRKQFAAQPQDASHGMALPDCNGRPIVQPERVTLACADGNFSIENISWTGWGTSFAAGKGTGKINDCNPSCVGGHSHSYPMLLIATGTQTCPDGQAAYEKVVYAFVGRSAFAQDAPGTTDPSNEFKCRAN